VKVFLSPHPDDEILFGAFTILRELPLVLIVFDSHLQPTRGYKGCDADTRRLESVTALEELCGLDAPEIRFLGFSDANHPPSIAQFQEALEGINVGDVSMVYAPAIEEGGHPQHNWLGAAAEALFSDRVTHYMTYTHRGKSTGTPVPFESQYVVAKLRALACFESQIALKDNVEHFLREQREYYQ
jgi:LmbE family N-acetylglucosaminyl deacetylase